MANKLLEQVKQQKLDAAENFIDALDEMEVKTISTFQFPSNLLMIKIMRACLGVTKIEDLWMYHPDY